MDSAEEALDYNSMDHGEVNRIFAADLLAAGEKGDSPHLPERPEGCFAQMGTVPFFASEILDLGTGTALIPIEICRQAPDDRLLAVDAAEHMLALGRQNVEKAGLTGRIRLERVDAKRLPYGDGQFAAVISNSIVHHLSDPGTAINEAWRVAAPGRAHFFPRLVPSRERNGDSAAWSKPTRPAQTGASSRCLPIHLRGAQRRRSARINCTAWRAARNSPRK